MNQPTARDDLRAHLVTGVIDGMHRADELINAFRDQVLAEAAEHLERIADEAEAQVAEHYGRASGIGPGSADMVREAARSARELAARTAQTPQET